MPREGGNVQRGLEQDVGAQAGAVGCAGDCRLVVTASSVTCVGGRGRFGASAQSAARARALPFVNGTKRNQSQDRSNCQRSSTNFHVHRRVVAADTHLHAMGDVDDDPFAVFGDVGAPTAPPVAPPQIASTKKRARDLEAALEPFLDANGMCISVGAPAPPDSDSYTDALAVWPSWTPQELGPLALASDLESMGGCRGFVVARDVRPGELLMAEAPCAPAPSNLPAANVACCCTRDLRRNLPSVRSAHTLPGCYPGPHPSAIRCRCFARCWSARHPSAPSCCRQWRGCTPNDCRTSQRPNEPGSRHTTRQPSISSCASTPQAAWEEARSAASLRRTRRARRCFVSAS